jgi:hypothetical protein
MSHELINDWNDSPPPTDAFLEREAAFIEKQKNHDGETRFDAYYAMIDSISTPQDLGQFLLRCSSKPGDESSPENPDISSYWDALAGVVVEDARSSMSNPWRTFARMLDKAVGYE